MSVGKSFTLKQVTEIIYSKIEMQFPTSFWLKAEINKLAHNPHSQHAYPELVEKENGKIVAQMNGTLFARTFQQINARFLNVLNEPLKEGIKALIHVKIQFSPLYGLSLNILDIDPSFTLGELERERLETLNRLKKEGLFDKNRLLPMPFLIQRLAIISGEGTQGFSDFISVLQNNDFGYAFYTHVFPAVMQGDAAVNSINTQLKRIAKVKQHFDAILIIRGGGGNVGMTCYNHYELAKSIANAPLPVFTGIGHSTNEFIADLVAAKTSITPTGIANFLVDRIREIEEPLIGIQQYVLREIPERLSEERKMWTDYAQNLRALTRLQMNLHKESQEKWAQKMILKTHLNLAKERVSHETILGNLSHQSQKTIRNFQNEWNDIKSRLSREVKTLQQHNSQKLETASETVRLLDPMQLLKRGYSITTNQNGIMKSIQQAKPGDVISTQLIDGTLKSIIT